MIAERIVLSTTLGTRKVSKLKSRTEKEILLDALNSEKKKIKRSLDRINSLLEFPDTNRWNEVRARAKELAEQGEIMSPEFAALAEEDSMFSKRLEVAIGSDPSAYDKKYKLESELKRVELIINSEERRSRFPLGW